MFVNGWYTKHFLKTAEQLTLCARPMWFSFWWGDEWNIQKQNVSTYYIKNYLYIWYILYINHLFMKIVHDILSVSSYEKATKKKNEPYFHCFDPITSPNRWVSRPSATHCGTKSIYLTNEAVWILSQHIEMFTCLLHWFPLGNKGHDGKNMWHEKPFCLLEGFYENVSLFCLGWTVATMVVLWLLAGLIFK